MITFIAVLVLSLPAHANSGGKTGSSTTGCGACHGASASASTTVTLEVLPPTVPAGATVDVWFYVENSTKSGAGLDVSATGGTLAAGSNTKLSGSEITQPSTQAIVSGAASFDFTWTAPTTPGTYTLRGAGNAVDGNGQTSGDQWNTTTTTVTVIGCAPSGTNVCDNNAGAVTCNAVAPTDDLDSASFDVYTGGWTCENGVCIRGYNAAGEEFFCNFPEVDVSNVLVNLSNQNDSMSCTDPTQSGATFTPSAAIPLEVHGGDGDDLLDGDLCQAKLKLYGDGGFDTMYGGPKNDKLFGGTGNDTMYGGAGSDTLTGGAGADFMAGEENADTLNGGDGADGIRGNGGDDTISGGNGNDSICGDEGVDALFGDGDDDKLHGGLGADTMDGGTGGSDRCQEAGPGCELNLASSFQCPVF